MDFASGYDLYDCLTYDGGCYFPPQEYKDLFFGPPGLTYTESCLDWESWEAVGVAGPSGT